MHLGAANFRVLASSDDIRKIGRIGGAVAEKVLALSHGGSILIAPLFIAHSARYCNVLGATRLSA
jgi:hypothetical protein